MFLLANGSLGKDIRVFGAIGFVHCSDGLWHDPIWQLQLFADM